MKKEKIAKILSKILSDCMQRIIIDKKDSETAFKETANQIHKQTGLRLKDSCNLVRLAVGIYLDEKNYAQDALKAIIGGQNETRQSD